MRNPTSLLVALFVVVVASGPLAGQGLPVIALYARYALIR